MGQKKVPEISFQYCLPVGLSISCYQESIWYYNLQIPIQKSTHYRLLHALMKPKKKKGRTGGRIYSMSKTLWNDACSALCPFIFQQSSDRQCQAQGKSPLPPSYIHLLYGFETVTGVEGKINTVLL